MKFSNLSYVCCLMFSLTFNSNYNIVNGKLLEFNEMKTIANQNDVQHFDRVLAELLKPRIVGTKNHEIVKDFIISELQSLGIAVQQDRFNDAPPGFQNLTFTNIIGKLNPNADKYLTLGCHYDSKYYREHYFVGATDSAVPCAIMLNIAKTLSSILNQLRGRTNLSLMLIFFDGEEAFREWTNEDSLYGSRHLAQMWDNKVYQRSDCGNAREIDRIDTLILLDLIGASNPSFYNYFTDTYPMHKRLSEIEKAMKSLNVLRTKRFMFRNKYGRSGIDDDHRPFLQKNVPVLHLIPTPFPQVWHKPEDNMENLSMNTIHDFNKIFRVFVYEYLNSIGNEKSLPKNC